MTATGTRQADQVTETGTTIMRLAKLWAAGTAMAVLLVASAYRLAQQLADPLVVEGAGEITLLDVVGFTIFGATVGAAVSLAIARFSRRPRLTFFAVTLIGLAGYAVVPLTAAESIGTALWLNLFHLVAAVPVIGMFARWLPRTSAEA